MTHGEFMALVNQWFAAWKDAHDAGEEGFGDETTLEDWLGSVEAFAALRELPIALGDQE